MDTTQYQISKQSSFRLPLFKAEDGERKKIKEYSTGLQNKNKKKTKDLNIS